MSTDIQPLQPQFYPQGEKPEGADGEVAFALVQNALDSTSIEDFLRTMVMLGSGALSRTASCAATLCGVEGKPLAAGNDTFSADAEWVQLAAEDGPGLQAMHTGELTQSTHLGMEPRWAGFRSQAVVQGVFSVLSLPLPYAGPLTGAVTYYASTPYAFTAADIHAARAFAAHAASAAAVAHRVTHLTRTAQQLTAAIDSRSVIDQAMGILMARDGCDPAEAFTQLRQASQHRNIKLRKVAETVVAHTRKT